jgi:hypothetical protein
MAAFLVVVLIGNAHAGQVVDANLKSTDYIAWIDYTGGSAEVYAGAFDVQVPGNPNHVTAYCVDLTHDMSVSGNVFQVDPGSFTAAFSPQVASEVGYLLSLDTTKGIGGAAIPQALGEAAVQLAIWSDIDPGFQATGFSSSDLGALYAYDRDASRGSQAGTHGVGYLAAEHVGNLYQNLAYALPSDAPFSATPEPSTLALGLLGGAGGLAFAWRRRTRTAA